MVVAVVYRMFFATSAPDDWEIASGPLYLLFLLLETHYSLSFHSCQTRSPSGAPENTFMNILCYFLQRTYPRLNLSSWFACLFSSALQEYKLCTGRDLVSGTDTWQKLYLTHGKSWTNVCPINEWTVLIIMAAVNRAPATCQVLAEHLRMMLSFKYREEATDWSKLDIRWNYGTPPHNSRVLVSKYFLYFWVTTEGSDSYSRMIEASFNSSSNLRATTSQSSPPLWEIAS